MHRSRTALLLFVLVAVFALVASSVSAPSASAQATISSGSIQGTILDGKGAAVTSAKVTVTSKGTGAMSTPSVTESGDYSVAGLVPGEYVLRVEANGFKTYQRIFTVQVGLITPGTVT